MLVMTYADLIQHYGTQGEAAKALRLSAPSVHGWKKASIPFDRQCQIEIATKGKLKARRSDDTRLEKQAA